MCSGSDSLFLGGRDGTVRIVAAGWKVVRAFAAYDDGSPVTHMRQVEGTSLLVTVGEEGGEAPPVLKVWALDKLVKKTGVPTCLSVVVVNNGKKPFPVGFLGGVGGVGLGVVLTVGRFRRLRRRRTCRRSRSGLRMAR